MDETNLPPPPPPGESAPPPYPPLNAPPPQWPPRLPPQPARRRNGWRIAAIVLGILLVLSVLSHVIGIFSELVFHGLGGTSSSAGPRLEEVTMESNNSAYKIAVVPLEGLIFSGTFDRSGYGLVRYLEDQLKQAGRDDKVKAVILRVNSPGGEVMASDDIYRAIAEFQRKYKKPVIASMSSVAASGGYYVSAPCRWIVANELTITGSIGVIMHSYNYRGLMNKVGLRPLVFKSGRFKDMLSSERDLEKMTAEETKNFQEEEKMLQQLIDQTFARFKKVVEEGRKNANQLNRTGGDPGNPLSEKWTDYADGRVLSGKEAYDLGFVDELGTWETAVKRARQLAGIANADLVQYQQVFDLSSLFRIFGKSETTHLKVDFGLDLPKLQAGYLYFLSPTYVH